MLLPVCRLNSDSSTVPAAPSLLCDRVVYESPSFLERCDIFPFLAVVF